MDSRTEFQGFTPETLRFLEQLKANNNKPWFEAHRDDYRRHLLRPFELLASELGEDMLAIDLQLEVSPAVNKTISRIYRDIRFSKDKTPYKTSMWLTFKRPMPLWQDTPVFFFELFSDWYRCGMGYYAATRETMDRLRAMILAAPAEFSRLAAALEADAGLVVEGESYRRNLAAPGLDESLRRWYQYKSFYVGCSQPAGESLFAPALADDVLTVFQKLTPLYHYLWRIREGRQ